MKYEITNDKGFDHIVVKDINGEDICILPLHFNLCFYGKRVDPNDPPRPSFYTYTEPDFQRKIETFVAKTDYAHYFIDLSYVDLGPTSDTFKKTSFKESKNVTFYLDPEQKERKALIKVLHETGSKADSENQEKAKYAHVNKEYKDKICVQDSYKKAVMAIIKDTQCLTGRPSYQESSSVFSSNYIQIKNMFASPDVRSANFVLYRLCVLLDKYSEGKNLTLISGSLTGSVIATAIASLMDRKNFYCCNIGPQFSIKKQSLPKRILSPEVRGRKYIYIFDIISLGTEIRSLNAMLSLNHARIVKCIGIASYIEPEKVAKTAAKIGDPIDEGNILNTIECLFFIGEASWGRGFELDFNDGILKDGNKTEYSGRTKK